MFEYLLGPLLGFTNRVRGGLFGDLIRKVIPFYGTTLGRAFHSLTFGFSYYMLFGDPLLSLGIAGTTFLGLAIAPFAPFQELLRSADLLTLSLRGVILTGATGVLIAVAQQDAVAGLIITLSGLMMGPIYLLAKHLPIIPFLNDDPTTRNTNDTAEVLFGVYQGLTLLLLLIRP